MAAKHIYEIDGARFSTLEGFFDEVEIIQGRDGGEADDGVVLELG